MMDGAMIPPSNCPQCGQPPKCHTRQLFGLPHVLYTIECEECRDEEAGLLVCEAHTRSSVLECWEEEVREYRP